MKIVMMMVFVKVVNFATVNSVIVKPTVFHIEELTWTCPDGRLTFRLIKYLLIEDGIQVYFMRAISGTVALITVWWLQS
jgi:hypothetical protein